MSDYRQTFGRVAARAPSPVDLLALEERADRHDRFAQVDALVAYLLSRSLNGERVISLDRGREATTIVIHGLESEQRRYIDRHFLLAHQQACGAWFLPEAATLKAGWANLPYHFRLHPRFAMGIVAEERGKVAFRGSPDALLVWAILEPLFELLFLPFQLRGPLLGMKNREWQRKRWEEAETFLAAMGFDVDDVLAPMRYGGGWSKLRAAEQLQAKQDLRRALMEQASRSQAAGFRAFQLQRLLSRYYQQVKKEPPKLRHVVTKDLQRVLAAFFGGNWLAFLAYIGEEPHPDERIATTLPETQLIIPDRNRVATAAAVHDLPVDEIERVVAAFWGAERTGSPVEARVGALQDVWRAFDTIHARQAPGMQPLWGLIEDEGISLSARAPYQAGLYRTLFSADLLARIDDLWGTCMLARWPERIVSARSPHALMAEAFGPALKFWHGCALTAWFICEGPYSRTDLPGLADYYQNELTAMARLGCPVDPSLFTDLVRAVAQLGQPEPIPASGQAARHELSLGIRITTQVSSGTRRAGLEVLRDIITRHRRVWAEHALEAYLRARWESEVRDAARDFSLLLERTGKPPRPRQFATHAVLTTNHWFGGDIGGLYRIIGEKAPVEPVQCTIMPRNREEFARSVLDRLTSFAEVVSPRSMDGGISDEREREQLRWNLKWLAEESLVFVQREEVLGRPPTLDEFGRERFAHRLATLAPEVGTAWTRYEQAIEAAKRSHGGDADGTQSDTQLLRRPNAAEVGRVTVSDVSGDASSQSKEVGLNRKPFWKRLLGG